MTGAEVAAALTRGDLTVERCHKTLRLLSSRKEYDAMLAALPPRWRAFAAEALDARVAQRFGGSSAP